VADVADTTRVPLPEPRTPVPASPQPRTPAPHAPHTEEPLPVPAFAELLDDARDGCPESTRWLYESVAGRVCGYLRVHGASDPEDLTNEVFLRVFDHLDTFDGDEHGYRSWVFTIAHRLLIDDHRRRSRLVETVELSGPVEESVAGGDVESDALAAVGDHEVATVLATLVPDQREVLTLRVVGDLTVDQVAEVLGKSRGAVKALQRRGVAALRRRFEEATA
jgi:RNA polymerase sigma-70 factor (ECF subfamily)